MVQSDPRISLYGFSTGLQSDEVFLSELRCTREGHVLIYVRAPDQVEGRNEGRNTWTRERVDTDYRCLTQGATLR